MTGDGGPRIAVLAPMRRAVLARQLPAADVVGVDDGDVVAACTGATAVVADWSGTHRISADVVDVLDGCELVQVPAAGLDGVDVDALHDAGIPLASCAGLNAIAVAEWVVWAALDGLRGFSTADREVRAGGWPQLGVPRFELAGRTVGIVGLGAIGRRVAERLRCFDVQVHYTSRTRRPADVERDLGIVHADLDRLLATSDVLVLACAATPETRGLLDAESITALRDGAVVVNAARGEVVDEVALADAVADGRLHAVVTDVYTEEPLPADHPLRGHDGITTTPHVAGVSAESVRRILGRVVDNLTAVLEGREPVGLVAAPESRPPSR